jgi:hypothetical protein
MARCLAVGDARTSASVQRTTPVLARHCPDSRHIMPILASFLIGVTWRS